MQSKRAELVPIAKVVSRLDGPVAAIREATPQALHHFTLADQVNQLVSASEAEPDLGFMARTMALCSPAPHQPWRPASSTSASTARTPSVMTAAGGLHKLPYGNAAAPDPGLGLDRSGTHSKSREIVARESRFPSSCGRWGSTAAGAGIDTDGSARPDGPAL